MTIENMAIMALFGLMILGTITWLIVKICAAPRSKLAKVARLMEKQEERDNKYLSLLNNIPDVIWTTNEKLATTFISPNVEKVYGYTAEEVCRDPELWYKTIHPQDIQRVSEEFNILFKKGIRFDIEYRIQRKDGQWIWVHDRALNVYQKNGQKWVDGIFSDITERKANEEEIRQLNRMHSFVTAINQAIVRIPDRDKLFQEVCRLAVEQGSFIMAWIGIVDYETSLVKPCVFWGFSDGYLDNLIISTKDTPEGRGPVGLAIRTGKPYISNDIESDPAMLPWKLEALKRGYRAVAAFPLRNKSQVIGALAVYSDQAYYFTEEEMDLLKELAMDISYALEMMAYEQERARSEQEIRRLNADILSHFKELQIQKAEAEKQRLLAESALRVKSDFMANMSHEVRTPLNAIIGFAEVLMDQYFGQLNEKQLEYVNNIHSSGQNLFELLTDILDLLQMVSDSAELQLNSFLLKDALQSSVNMFKGKADSHKISLFLEIAPAAQIEIEADQKKLKQVMYNLLSNAVKFTPDGGSVRVWADRLIEGEDHIMESLQISITDTGIGIRPEDRPRLFQEFEQLESPYSKKYPGLGIGLALTKKLVEFMGGKIWVESEGLDKGSKFTFTLPMTEIK